MKGQHMDPILALIGDLYQQITVLQQENQQLREVLEQREAGSADD